MATNILNTLYLATDNFRSTKINAKTFELAALCNASGAVRFERKESEKNITNLHKKIDKDVKKKDVSRNYLQEQQLKQPAGGRSVKDNQSGETQAPEDWLRPKIYKSNNN